ncbi:ABC transporter permease [Nonomuraea lactucae]|uniref:ABC transporter permease n=1 Tax=Nonomuraea lactucae TaxID=2249762 RepID=UPI000DE4D2BF|nr:ABC transporter permease [Nonomuraea lactucae]
MIVRSEEETVPAEQSAGRHGRRMGGHSALLGFVERYGLLLLLVVECVVFSLLLPDTFATVGNFKSMASAQAITLLLTVALALPLRGGEFDLSIAGLMTASGAVTAVLLSNGVSLVVGIAAGLGLGLVVGFVNTGLIVRLGVDSFVTTLGMSTALGGLAYAVSDSTVVVNLPEGLLALGREQFFGLQSVVWIGWGIALVAWYVFEFTPFGRYLLFVGGSPGSARLAGIRVNAVRTAAFMACSLIAAFAGVLLIGNVGQMDPSIGSQFLLQPFAGVFLGATAITVGRVNILGAIIALYVLEVGITGLQLMGAQPWVSDVFNGTALVVAVTLSLLAARSRRRA